MELTRRQTHYIPLLQRIDAIGEVVPNSPVLNPKYLIIVVGVQGFWSLRRQCSSGQVSKGTDWQDVAEVQGQIGHEVKLAYLLDLRLTDL